MKKEYLLTPGPSQVPSEVLLTLARPVFHHRTKRFQAIYAETLGRLKQLFCAEQSDVVVFASSGTGAMEASVVNVVPPGKKALCVQAGKFGERWGEICKAFGIEYTELSLEWGKATPPALIAEHLAKDPTIAAVYVTLCETSTGVENDIQALAEVVRKTPALLVVDGISGGGAIELRFDEWGVDLLAVGSQKALMLPPGLALLVVSPKAKAAIKAHPRRMSYYFDLVAALEKIADNDTPYTPALTLITALNEALKLIEAEGGVEAVWARHRLLAEATRAAVQALGLTVFSERPSAALTTVVFPAGVDAGAVKKNLEAKGVSVADGQGKLKGKVIRIAHMGYCNQFDVLIAIGALEMVLAEMGAKVQLGAGLAAAEAVFVQAARAAAAKAKTDVMPAQKK